MASGLGLDILQDSGKFPCAVRRTGVGRSSIRCSKWSLWVHYKKCSGLKTLAEDMSYECPRCHGEPGVRPIDGRPFKEVDVGDCVLEAVDRFCYLGDMLSAGGGCMAAATARCRCAWGKFRENLPLLTSKPVPFDLRGHLFSSNVRSSMLHDTETWPMTSDALHRLCRNDRAMIRWIWGVKPSDDPSMDDLHAKLGICDLAVRVRERRLRWFGHVMLPMVRWIGWGPGQSLGGRVLDGRRRLGMSAWSKIWKCVVYLRPALRIECSGDHLWRTVDRSLPRLTGVLLRAWLRLRHGTFWGCASAPLTKLHLTDWLIELCILIVLKKKCLFVRLQNLCFVNCGLMMSYGGIDLDQHWHR